MDNVTGNVEKYGRDGQATNDRSIRLMRFACWVTKATNAHSEYVILNCVSTAKMVKRTRLNIYVVSTLPVLLLL